MEQIRLSTEDSGRGQPQRHHDLYLKDGTLTIQVENVLFNVHRSVLARASTVIQDIMDMSSGENNDGTEEKPLVLTGDTVAAWELFLRLQYPTIRILPEALTAEQLLTILPIANKYRMERVETDIIQELKKFTDYEGSINLVAASRIVGSDELYQNGVQRLISFGISPNSTQARRIGAGATHAVMEALMDAVKAAYAEEVASLKAQAKAEVAAIKAKSEQEISNMNSEIATIKLRATEEKQTIKAKAEKEKTAIRSKAKEDIAAIRSKAEEEKTAIRLKAEEEKAALRSKHNEEIAALKAKRHNNQRNGQKNVPTPPKGVAQNVMGAKGGFR